MTSIISYFKALPGALQTVIRWVFGVIAVAAAVAALVGILLTCQSSNALNSISATFLAFILGAGAIAGISNVWLRRIEHHPLLRSDEKLQNKDALVIFTASLLAMHLGLCVVAAGAAILFPERGHAASFLAIAAALAALAVGGAFGFLLGHPRRLADDAAAKDGRTGSNWLLKTGLDDIVDWLVKGITTVLLVDSKQLLTDLVPLAKSVGAGIAGTAVNALPDKGYTFALSLIVYFAVFGAGATCLVTRTYLTGALGRADRSTVNAFSRVGLDWGEILVLSGAQRFLGSRSGEMTTELRNVAEKLAALSLADLHTPHEYSLWAKAKSISQTPEALQDAIRGYEKAILQCDCDPALLLDYAVALSQAKKDTEAITRLEQAYRQISRGTPQDICKNIYKSLTFALLYHPNHYDRVIDLINEYFAMKRAPSGGLFVNRACAFGQKFHALADAHRLLQQRDSDGILCLEPAERTAAWPEPLLVAYDGALQAMRDALERDSDWKRRFLDLLVHDAPGKAKEDNDLEVFEAFPDFRTMLTLRLLDPSASKPLLPPQGGSTQTTAEAAAAEAAAKAAAKATEEAAAKAAEEAAAKAAEEAAAKPAAEGAMHVEVKETPTQEAIPPPQAPAASVQTEGGEGTTS